MKLFLFVLAICTNTCFASDVLVGTVILKGQKIQISAETNMNTARVVVVGKQAYRINRMNVSEIAASQGENSVEIYFGENFRENMLTLSSDELSDGLNLSNGKELKCSSLTSKAFVVLRSKTQSLGNCLN